MILMRLSSTEITLLSLPFLLPFVYIPFLWNPYEFSKFLVLVISVQILVIIFAIKYLKQKKRSSFFSFDLLSITILLFLAVTLLSDVFGLDPKVSLLGGMYRHQGFITQLLGIFYFFLLREYLSISDKKQVLNNVQKFAGVSAFILSGVAIWHAISFNIFHDISVPTYQGRIVATMGNPNFLGGYLAMLLPLVVFSKRSHLDQGETLTRGALRWVLAGILLVTILLSGSRGAILSAGVIMLIYLKKYTSFIQVILYIFMILLAIYYNDTYHYSDKLFETRKSSIWDNRVLIWTEGVKAVMKRPILGYGQENFELVFPKERIMKVDNAHNIFLEVAVSSGIVGLVLFLTIISIALRRAFWPVKLSLLTFLIIAQFNPLSIAQIALFWFLLGVSSVGN